MNGCHSPESVQRILKTPDDEVEFQALLAHVQQCARCQEVWSQFDDRLIETPTTVISESADTVPPEVMRRLKLLAAPARSSCHGEEARNGSQDSVRDSGRLEVRCPSCHAPMEVAVDTLLTDLTCGACGSHFSLIDEKAGKPPLSSIGRFELIARVGFGAFGTVWRARDTQLDRTVAVKLPRHAGMTSQEQEMFFREARTAAQLRHPNIVSVHEVGRDAEQVYIVSDFVCGETLSDWLADQQLTNREAAELCAKIADTLQHAHEQGIVHRDLKPANILVDENGEPHLTDFGLARRDVGEVTMTLDGQVLGTPAYMSPEQAQGSSHTADRRSDVYSLGVVLFQLLTKELPFRGNARMIMHQVIHDEPPSPRLLNADVARDVETIVLKCLEKVPERRYDSAGEVADELRRFLAGQPIIARPINWVERKWRWSRNNRATAMLLAALPTAAVIIAIIATLASVRINSERRRTTDGLYHSLVREAATLRTARTPGYRHAAWSLLKQASALDTQFVDRQELRQEAVRCMGDFVALDPVTIEVSTSDVTSVQADGEQNVCVGTQDGTVALTGPRFRTLTTIGQLGSPIVSMAFSARAGILVCATADGRLVVWKRNESQQWKQAGEPVEVGDVVAIVADGAGKCMYVRRPNEQRLEVWELGADAPKTSIPVKEQIVSAAVDNDLQLVAAGDSNGTLHVWDIGSGSLRAAWPTKVGAILDITFSSHSRHIACAGGDGFVIMDATSGERLLHNKESGCNCIALSPTGRLCAVEDPQGRIRLWNTVANSPYAELSLDNTAASLERGRGDKLGFSRDGGTFFSIDRTRVRLWNLQRTPEMQLIEAHDGGVPGVAFSPDGRSLASVGKDGRCVITDLSSGRSLQVVASQEGRPLQAVTFHPGGRYIAIGGWGRGVEIWDLKSIERVTTVLEDGEVWSVAFNSDGTQFAASGKGGAWLWRVDVDRTSRNSLGLRFNEIARYECPITFYCNFSPTTQELFWSDPSLTFFDSPSHRPVRIEHVRIASEVMPFGLLPQSKTVLITPDGNLQMHELPSGKMRRKLVESLPPKRRVSGVAVSANGSMCAFRNSSSEMTIYDLDRLQPVFDVPSSPTPSTVWFWKWSPDASRLAIASADGRVYVWNIDEAKRQLLAAGL